ncbi:hypothetical protein [Dokdonella sp.]|uniref:hypothetical protein n=1 Tax=Dokdonella sp. TaxID=2291710 RepID=UPI0025C1B876|nr:hypothetical protein [Dokdonella sp.]MBX3692646.1 hypothetical protein [Dokdonella sp.]
MMKISAAQAKSITKDWQNEFPSLGVYKPLHLLRRCGPILVGLCLNRASSGDIYKPTFHSHCLLRQFPTISLSLAVQLKAANGTDAAVSVKFHESKLAESATKMRALALLPFEGDLKLSQFDDACAKWLRQQQSPYWPSVLEDRVLLHAWSGVDFEKTLREAEAILKSWPSFVTDKIGGTSGWLARVDGMAGDRNALEDTLASEIEAHGLVNLPTGSFFM